MIIRTPCCDLHGQKLYDDMAKFGHCLYLTLRLGVFLRDYEGGVRLCDFEGSVKTGTGLERR